MSAWWWKGSLVAVCAAASCGGVSTSRKDDDGSSAARGGTGGTLSEQGGGAGTQRGGAPATGGTASGGRGPRGGSAGTTSGASGNAGFGGDRGGSGGGTGDGGAGMCSDGGEPSRDFRCELYDQLTTCPPEATCAGLGCGEPWSYFDGELCPRRLCRDSISCPGSERCVATPVAGKFELPHGELDICGDYANDCGCTCGYFEDGTFWAGVCLTDEELPPVECPIDALDCSALIEAAEVTSAYIVLYDGPDESELGNPWPKGDTLAGLKACRAKIQERELSVCPF